MNHVVGMDLVELKGLGNDRHFWLNVVCWGTSFQLVGHIGPEKAAEQVYHTFVRVWVRVFGLPECIVVDPGTEFQGYFADMVQGQGVCLFPTDARAPWQNGRTERAGKEWKRQFKLARRKEEPTTHAEWIALGEMCCRIRNRYQNRSGFSPMQRVFGYTHRLLASLLSDDVIDPEYLCENPLEEFHRAEN